MHQPQAFHKDINLGPVKLPTIKPFHMKKFYLLSIIVILGDSRNYMPPILEPLSAKCIATQILAIVKLNGRKDFILRVFVCDIICPSKELPVQS